MTLSTSDLSLMPDIKPLRKRMQQLAAITSVLSGELYESQFQFYPKWDRKEKMGAFKDGSGDELFAHFTRVGCFIMGFAHESEMTPYRTDPPALWPGLLASVPDEFKPSMNEPAFDKEATTFAIWRRKEDAVWSSDDVEFPNGDYRDGSEELLAFFVITADDFTAWLEDNYEVEVDGAIVASVFENRPLSKSQVKKLNPDKPFRVLRKVVEQTGYSVEPRK